jgi:UDP-glucose 4-epimerase
MRSFVVGGAGFIGSHLVDLLVDRGPVTVFDNLSVGKTEFIASHLTSASPSARATFVRGDALVLDALTEAMRGHDIVFHLAANPDARTGLERTGLDLEQGTIAAYHALEAARLVGAKRFVLASSGTVYGNTAEPRAEMDLGHLPVSLYGASKLACEAMVAAYAECFGLRGTIARIGNVVGPRATHGAILDFCRKLKAHRDYLDVLGDGCQSKPYLHVSDCAAGLLYLLDHAPGPVDVYNLAPSDATTVAHIAEACVAASPQPRARIVYSGGTQGWRGDVATSRLVPDKIRALGFALRYTSDQAVDVAVGEVASEVFGARPW